MTPAGVWFRDSPKNVRNGASHQGPGAGKLTAILRNGAVL